MPVDYLTRIGIAEQEMRKLITPSPKPKNVSIALIGIGLEQHFDWELAKKSYTAALQQTKDVFSDENILLAHPTPVQTKKELLEMLNDYFAQGMSGLIVYQASFISGDLALTLANWLRDQNMPILSWSHAEVMGGRLTANRLCGQNFLLNSLNSMGVKYSWVFDEPESSELTLVLDRFVRVVTTKARLKHAELLMIGGMRVPGFFDCELNEISIAKHFELGIERVDIETVWKHGEKFNREDIHHIVDQLVSDSRCNMQNVSAQELFLSVRFSLAIADYVNAGGYLGVALKNWPELFDNYQIAGDGAGALVQDLGIPVADESDMGGLLTMVTMNGLSNGKALPTLMDLSVLNTKEDKIGAWHCGGSPTRLLRDGTSYQIRNHSILDNFDKEKSYGMLLEFLQETGPVTIAKYQYPHASYMLSFEGNIVDSPLRFRGSYGEIHPTTASATDIIGSILSQGLDHHWIIGRGHIREDLHEFNHWIDVKELPFTSSGISGRSQQKEMNYQS
ncbi:hypothetical protein FNH22_08820 [Fulvivirga sp. M361]|uniref:L-fucose/L-arabinose isomerase family protein n=1 Tax=Fulvivirga sp. M361 TaxID=2594266 RepID=UPI001179ADEE|nr:hypothetical protein [Fulvivirga sp. M361]TRX60141.1 hypothetical protein FNH22_08820 [Fulvivirga sp. M361]